MCSPRTDPSGFRPSSQSLTYKDGFGIVRPRTSQQLRLEREAEFQQYLKTGRNRNEPASLGSVPSQYVAPTPISSNTLSKAGVLKIDPNAVDRNQFDDKMELN